MRAQCCMCLPMQPSIAKHPARPFVCIATAVENDYSGTGKAVKVTAVHKPRLKTQPRLGSQQANLLAFKGHRKQ